MGIFCELPLQISTTWDPHFQAAGRRRSSSLWLDAMTLQASRSIVGTNGWCHCGEGRSKEMWGNERVVGSRSRWLVDNICGTWRFYKSDTVVGVWDHFRHPPRAYPSYNRPPSPAYSLISSVSSIARFGGHAVVDGALWCRHGLWVDFGLFLLWSSVTSVGV